MRKIGAFREKLLKAALLSGPEGISAWQSIEPRINVDRMDAASHRLMPLVLHNLQASGISEDLIHSYKHITRYYWYKNQMIIAKTAPLLAALHNGGIESMLLKGVPLALERYPKLALRPFRDLDLMVKLEQVDRAIEILNNLGYELYGQSERPSSFAIRHSMPFMNMEEINVDLHWRALYNAWPSFEESIFWEESVPLRVGEANSRTLSSADHFLHVCLHGGFERGDFIWVADAAMILRGGQEQIDWDRIVRLAAELRLSVLLADQLRLLQDILDINSLDEKIKKLESNPKWRYEALEFRNNNASQNVIRKLIRFWLRNERLFDMPIYERILNYPVFLYRTWSWFASITRVPAEILRKLRH